MCIFFVALVIAIVIINKIYYAVYIHINFPKGTWVNTIDNTLQYPVYDGKTLCAYLFKIKTPYEKQKSHWSCINAKVDTILHNIDGDFVYDCKQNPELCKIELEKEMYRFFMIND